jgi:HAD superfamily hydrolase (TIGR01509 family)
MTRREAIIFDMDGVIVDSEPRHERAFLDVVREIGYAGRLTLRFADYVGRTDRELWADFVAAHKPPYTLDQLLAMKRERTLEVIRQEKPLFKGLPDLVRGLAARFSLAVASGSERLVVEEVLRIDGLGRFFPVVVTSADVPRGKPAPDIFLRTAELLEVEPAACWVVEDSKAGVAAALAAGMQVIAITNTYPAEALANATHVVRTYEEIGQILLA